MLILAGVSLNAVIGENGIITQAQNAKIATAVGSFNEYMQSWFFNKKMEDEGYNIEDLYVSAGWLERKLDIDDEGNAYYVYIIDKSKVTDEEILKYMQAGDGDPYSLQDVYGINSDFSIWYKDSFGNLINSQIKVLAIDDNTEVNFTNPALSQAISNSVGVDKDNVTIGDLKNVTTLKLNYDGTDNDIKNLNDLYYLPSLANLHIYNLTLDNIDGLKYCTKINTLEINKCNIKDFNGLKYSTSLRILRIYGNRTVAGWGISNENVDKFFEAIKDISTIYELILSASGSDFTNIDSLNKGLQNLSSKSSINILSLSYNGLSGELNLSGMNSITNLNITSNKYITGILGLEKINKLATFSAEDNSIVDISNLNMIATGYKYIYLKKNLTLNPESITAISEQLLSAKEYTIDYQFSQYIEGNKSLDYSYAGLNDGDITYVADSVENLNLMGNSKLTNIEFLRNKSNIKTLNLSACTSISQEKLNEILPTLTGINTLYLANLPNLTTIEFIKYMTNIDRLEIANTNVEILSEEDVDAITLNTSSLKQLNIGTIDDKKYKGNNINLTFIQPCISNLTGNLGLYISSNEAGYRKFANQLSECMEITNLYMRYYAFKGVDTIDLTKCVKLKAISMNAIRSNLLIEGLSKLEVLELSNMTGGTEYYKMPNISGCNNLNRITFVGNFMTNTDLENICNQLDNTTKLQRLTLYSNSISKINSISKLNSLQYLNLNNNNISDLTGIEELSNLTEIQLKYNSLNTENLVNIVNLYNEYNKIRNIYLYGNNITDYSSLEKFANKAALQEP